MKIQHFICFLAAAGLSVACSDSSTIVTSTLVPETTDVLCADGIDNDENGISDCSEDSCKSFDNCKGSGKSEICDNWKDDDGDGVADCGDTDCANAPNCKGSIKVEICDNNADDDEDGDIDCNDADCASAANCKGSIAEICDNWRDDDGDELADCGDSDCANAENCKGVVIKVEICDNDADDDEDGDTDCDDTDCANDAHCNSNIKVEICDNDADDDEDGDTDCDDTDCDNDAHCNSNIKVEICDNDADDDEDGDTDCDDTDCVSDENCVIKDLGALKYKVGLISDIHFDTDDDHGAQHAEDLVNALTYFRNNNVSFIASCGDYVEYKTDDFSAFYDYYNAHAWAPTYTSLRLFSAIGNHDYLQMSMIPDGEAKDVWIGRLKSGFDSFTGEDIYKDENDQKDMHFFEYDGAWNTQYAGGRTNQGKLSYWYKKDNDIYVFLSIDYGDTPLPGTWGVMSRAMNLLNADDKYVKQMKEYVADTAYDQNKDKLFDYQFYHPNALIWLKDIIENNTDKRIFVFMHHFITHKAGNGVTYNGKTYYSDKRVWPYTANTDVQKKVYAGSNSLSGLEFHFINKLNNKYKNVTWFSGHTHYQWEDEAYDSCLCFCNKDFDFVLPTGDEVTPLVDSTSDLTDYKRYTRVSDTPKGECGYTIHIPSLSKPVSLGDGTSLYKASQGGIMEVYENGFKILGISFKKADATAYENKVVVTKEIFLR